MATPLPHSRTALPDAQLARLSAGGDGEAFAALYDRHEQRVYGYCIRLLCSPHDAAEATQETFVRMLARLPALEGKELNFIAYTLTAARNACYDMIAARRTVEPVAEHPEPGGPPEAQPGTLERDPERRALLEASREQVRAANAALPARQREVLALREVENLSYEQIGELMGLNRNAVAQLISRARIKLHELVRGGALAAVGASSPECERALPLLAALQDGEDKEEQQQREWLRLHLARCETCRVGRAAMEEAGVSYRALGPIVAAVWLRKATIARAGESVGADWSQVAARPAHAASGGNPDAATPGTGIGAAGAAGERRLARVARWLHPGERPRRAAGALLAALLGAIALLIAATGITRDSAVHPRTLTLVNPPSVATTQSGSISTTTRRPAPTTKRHRAATLQPSARVIVTTPVIGRGHALHQPAQPVRRHRAAAHHKRGSRKAKPKHTTPAAPPPSATTPTQPTTTTTPPTTTTTTTTTTTPANTETTETTKRPEEPPAGTPGAPAGGGGGVIP